MARRTRFMGEAPLMEKKSFIKTGEGVIGSYEWKDLQQNSGLISLYALSTGGNNILIGRKITSRPPYARINSANKGDIKPLITREFDFEVNKPLILQGRCFIETLGAAGRWDSGTATGNIRIDAQIKVIRGENTINLTNQIEGEEATYYTTGTIIRQTLILPLLENVVPLGRGDIIRAKIILYGHLTSGTSNSSVYYLFHDPYNFLTAKEYINKAGDDLGTSTDQYGIETHPTDLIVNIPFRIDL